MSKVISAMLTVGAIMPLFWYTVVPSGVELCNSSTEFRTPLDNHEIQRYAAKIAKSQFCNVVSSYPQ